MALLELTTIARVKSLLDITGSDSDSLLTSLVQGVSASFEQHLGRKMNVEARTVELDVYPRTSFVWVDAYPITSITSIKSSSKWDWTVDDLATELYHADTPSGRIIFDTTLNIGPAALQVVYTGGLAVDTSTLISDFPDIATAADLQVAEEFRRRDDPALRSKGFATEKARSYVGGMQLLDRVLEILAPYRRMVVSF